MVMEWGAGADHVFGWREAEAVGRHAGFLFTPEDRAVGRLHQDMVAADRAGRALADRWHLTRNGRRLWSSVELTPLAGRDGQQLGYVLVVRDRSEQHRVDTALKVAEQSLRWAQQAGRLGLFQVGEDAILHATPEFCRMFGLPPSATLPVATVMALILPEDRAVAAPLWTVRAARDIPSSRRWNIASAAPRTARCGGSRIGASGCTTPRPTATASPAWCRT